MTTSRIKTGRKIYSEVIKVTSRRRPISERDIQMVRKITFFKILKNGRVMQQTTTGFSVKFPSQEITLMENSAFQFCVAQLEFSYDEFKEVDRAFIEFIPKETIEEEREFSNIISTENEEDEQKQ